MSKLTSFVLPLLPDSLESLDFVSTDLIFIIIIYIYFFLLLLLFFFFFNKCLIFMSSTSL